MHTIIIYKCVYLFINSFSLVKLENEFAGSKKLLADATLKINTLENELKFEKDKLNVEIERRKKLQVCNLIKLNIICILYIVNYIFF